jgi:nicotinamide-nucleotide amidase
LRLETQALQKDSNAQMGLLLSIATPSSLIVEEFNFKPREKVIDRAVYKSLEMLQKILKKML